MLAYTKDRTFNWSGDFVIPVLVPGPEFRANFVVAKLLRICIHNRGVTAFRFPFK